MNANKLRNALEADLDRYGDGSSITLDAVVDRGRSRRRATGVRRVVGSVAALTVGGGAAFALTTGSAAAADWTLAPAPEQVNQQIVDLVKAELPAGTSISDIELLAFQEPPADQGGDEPGGIRLAEADWDQADAWRATVKLASGGRIVVFLRHARSETEGDAAAHCEADLAKGLYEVCDAGSVSRQGEDVETIWRISSAEMTAEGLLFGQAVDTSDPNGPETTPVSLQVLEAQPGGDFLVSAHEIIPEGETAVLDQDALADIALAEQLLDAR